MKLVAVLVAVGCRDEPAPKPQAPLADYLEQVSTLDVEARQREGETWRMDRATWSRIVVAPFDALYDDYAKEYRPPMWLGPISTRPHFAGDPDLTLNQARARWLFRPLFPALLARTDRTPVDAVFVHENGRWYALVGIDLAIRRRIDRRDPACGAAIDAPTVSKSCRDAAWAVADATLRTDDTRFTHACAIAKTACAKPSP